MRALIALSACIGLLGCATSGDDSMYLTGTEEYAVQMEDGTYVCESPKKVLICHIPPGNPENAHTICVGAPAVSAHEAHHGDPVGPCDDGPGDDGTGDAGTGDDGTGADGTGDDGTGDDGTGDDGTGDDGTGDDGTGDDGGEDGPVE